MRTKEKHEGQSEEILKLYGEVSRKIAQTRRTLGISHCELADRLGIPPCYTEILENGIMVFDSDQRCSRWNGCPFTGEELSSISRKLSEEVTLASRAQAPDPETVFFCPVTISSTSVLDDLRSLARDQDAVPRMRQRVVGRFGMKYRLLYHQLCLQSGRKAAELMKREILALITAYLIQPRSRTPD